MRKVVIITGLPATGKSTLKKQLIKAKSIPFFSKDDVKETLYDTIGVGSRSVSRKQGSASYEILFYIYEQLLCTSDISFGLEGVFLRVEHGERFSAIAEEAGGAEFLQIVMKASPRDLVKRHAEREKSERHAGHPRDEFNLVQIEQDQNQYENLFELPGERLVYDTSLKTPPIKEIINGYVKFLS